MKIQQMIPFARPPNDQRSMTTRQLAFLGQAYALKVSQLSENMRDFLKQVRVFFTKPHSLKRHGHFLAQSTYLKVEERLCCKCTESLRFMFRERAGHFWLNRPSTLPKPWFLFVNSNCRFPGIFQESRTLHEAPNIWRWISDRVLLRLLKGELLFFFPPLKS